MVRAGIVGRVDFAREKVYQEVYLAGKDFSDELWWEMTTGGTHCQQALGSSEQGQ